MAHVRLKSLVEEIQREGGMKEAAIHPSEGLLDYVRDIIISHLETGKFVRMSFFKRFWKEFQYQIARITLGDDLVNRKEDEARKMVFAVLGLNRDLEAFRISFNPYLDATTLGAVTKKGEVLVNPGPLFMARKVNGKWTEVDDMIATIGHELIHRGQYDRGMIKDKERKQGAGGTKQYFNDYPEVMAWAYTIVNRNVAKGETFQDFINLIKTSPALKEFLQRYTPENRKKIVRYMIDYARRKLTSEN